MYMYIFSMCVVHVQYMFDNVFVFLFSAWDDGTIRAFSPEKATLLYTIHNAHNKVIRLDNTYINIHVHDIHVHVFAPTVDSVHVHVFMYQSITYNFINNNNYHICKHYSIIIIIIIGCYCCSCYL